MVWDRSVEAASTGSEETRIWSTDSMCNLDLPSKCLCLDFFICQRRRRPPESLCSYSWTFLSTDNHSSLQWSRVYSLVLLLELTNRSAWITTVGFSLAKQPFLLSVRVLWVAVTAQIQLHQTLPRLQSQELSSGSMALFEKLTVRLRTIVGIIRKRSSLPARCGAVAL